MRNDRIRQLLQECRERQKRKRKREEEHLKALQRQILDDIAYRQRVREKRAERAIQKQQERLKEVNQDLHLFRLCFDEEHLYTTREELYEREDKGDGKINWDVWDRLVQQFHKDNGMTTDADS